MFKYTLDNKRYHTLNYYYQKKYGCKVFKVSLNAHFSCPNIDGTKGYVDAYTVHMDLENIMKMILIY